MMFAKKSLALSCAQKSKASMQHGSQRFLYNLLAVFLIGDLRSVNPNLKPETLET